jgi:hypothetical protein
MKKISLVLGIISIILMISNIFAQGVGVGINTYSITLRGGLGDSYTSNIGIMNPSVHDIKVKVYFDCRDCIKEKKIFGYKYAEKIDDPTQYFKLSTGEVLVPGNTPATNAVPVSISFAPKLFVIKHIRFFTPGSINFFIHYIDKHYSGGFTLPYPTLLIGKKQMNGIIVADVVWSSFGPLGVTPSVGSTLAMTATGMPVSSFIIILIALIIIIFLIIKLTVFKGKLKIRDFIKKISLRGKKTNN